MKTPQKIGRPSKGVAIPLKVARDGGYIGDMTTEEGKKMVSRSYTASEVEILIPLRIDKIYSD